MPRPSLPMEGACRCGAIRLRLTEAPVLTAACHCRGCQRMSSSAFSLTAMVPAQGLQVLQGTPVVCGARSAALTHMACPDCATWLFTRITALPDYVNLRPTLLQEVAWFTPFIETMCAEALPWARTPAKHRFAGFPDAAEFGALLEDYAAQS